MTDDSHSIHTLFELLAYRAGFQKIESTLSIPTHPLLVWAISFVVFDLLVVQGIRQLQGYTAVFIKNPVWLIQPAFAIVGAYAVVYLHRQYERALNHIDIEARTSDSTTFESLGSYRFRAALYLVAIGYNYWNLIVNVGIETTLQIGGVAELIGVAIVAPFGYGIIYAEFLATYVGIMIVLPRKIRQTDFKVNFLDPEGLGGLRPIGELAKMSYYFIVVGLVGYVIFTYGPFILGDYVQTSYPEPGPIIDTAFTGLWLLTILTMAYGLSQLHWFMKREKRKELKRLDRKAREFVANPFDIEAMRIEDQEQYDNIRQQMDRVNGMKEYPTTFTMWSQILLSLVLPKAVQLVLSNI